MEQSRPNVAIADDIVCPACGYDLRGIPSYRCPECGQLVDRDDTSLSHIPWEHRHQIGLWRAYWRTGMMVLRAKLLAREMDRPVSLDAANRFRRFSTLLATTPSLVWVAYAYREYARHYGPSSFLEGNKLSWLLDGLLLLTGIASVWLFFVAVSGLSSYFFHPSRLSPERQKRGIALSFYGCAPLAWVWVPAVLFAIGWGITGLSNQWDDFAWRTGIRVFLLAAFAGVVVAGTFWIASAGLMETCMKTGRCRQIAFAFYMPAACALVFGLCCGLILAVALISLMLLSLT